MRTLTLMTALLISGNSWAYGPWSGPGWYPGWGSGPVFGYGLGAGYGMGVIQTPSFSYTTTIVQSPPIIVNQNREDIPPRPDRGYQRRSDSQEYDNRDR
jgi:hypothetical protein